MKKSAFWCMLLICCSCVAFTGGFYVGRNLNRTPVRVEALPQDGNATASTDESAPKMVNINTATLEQLQALPNIGPVLAQRIVDYRLANGPFENTADIAKVPGIGGTILEAILEQITVGG